MRRPIAVDLFSGAGGMSLGFEQAGFDIVAAVEIDPVHAAIHHYNFPTCRVLAKSITEIAGQEICDAGGVKNGAVDVVFGGAPCQGFSSIGQRALDDPRNSLVCEFLRIVGDLRASYFVFENVKGLTVGKHVRFLHELIDTFHSSGYQIAMPWQALNASSFGVPQSRERLFLLGARNGLPLPSYPVPTTRLPDFTDDLFGVPRSPTCKEAIGDLPDAEDYADLISDDAVDTDAWGIPSDYARQMRCMTDGSWHFGHARVWDPNLLTSSMRTKHTSISRRRFAETESGTIEPISRFFKLPADGVCNTLRAGTDSSRGAFTSPRPIHYEKPRCITVREMARLHGFPDWFRFHKTKWHGARQIGNAVPPPLARAVASEVMKALGIDPVCPGFALPLGEETLLEMDMSEAAAYWKIPVPIGRRDRKSGAKKRNQLEIEASRLRGFGEHVHVQK